MTLEDLSRLETMHAEVHPAAPAEIYQWFPEMAKALREARASVLHWRTQWAVMAELANQNLREKQNAESERDEARAAATRQTERLMQEEELSDHLHKEKNEAQTRAQAWEETAQKVVALFDPLNPRVSPEVLSAVAQGVKAANLSLRADRVELRAEIDRLKAEVQNAESDRAILLSVLEGVAKHTGVSVESVCEDPSVVVRERDAARAEVTELTDRVTLQSKVIDDTFARARAVLGPDMVARITAGKG